MKKTHICTCGYRSEKYLLFCPHCKQKKTFRPVNVKLTGSYFNNESKGVVRLSEIKKKKIARQKTGISELDEVLDGGLVPAQQIVLSAPPGMGKSTLASMLAASFSKSLTVLYNPGEESAVQTRYRTDRINATSENVYITESQKLDNLINAINEVRPSLLVVDSIQSLYDSRPDIGPRGGPGTVAQVKHCANQIVSLCKQRNIICLMIAHVTKDNELAGPKALEHLIDTFLFLDGDRNGTLRILRSPKNRFGAPGKVGMFHMRDDGLIPISPENNALQTFKKRETSALGSVYTPVAYGDRFSIVEVQALVCPSTGVSSSKTVQGLPSKQVQIILGTLYKYCKINLGASDLIIKVVGGLQVDDPSLDLAVATAILSSYLEVPFPNNTVVMGEIGLTGEISQPGSVDDLQARLRLAYECGFDETIYNENLKSLSELPTWFDHFTPTPQKNAQPQTGGSSSDPNDQPDTP
jgi:DNA repair protein RadA/Sms